ncbi:MAG: pilus assembly PilX N-terminal domain-containing protein [Patescibacteria group bacterium]
MIKIFIKNQKGYVALISVLMILAVCVIIGITVSLNAVNEMQMGLSGVESQQAFITADACTEEGLIRLKRKQTPPTSMTFSQGSCTIQAVADDGGECNLEGDACFLQVTGNVGDYYSLIEVELNTGDDLSVSSWEQVGDFSI